MIETLKSAWWLSVSCNLFRIWAETTSGLNLGRLSLEVVLHLKLFLRHLIEHSLAVQNTIDFQSSLVLRPFPLCKWSKTVVVSSPAPLHTCDKDSGALSYFCCHVWQGSSPTWDLESDGRTHNHIYAWCKQWYFEANYHRTPYPLSAFRGRGVWAWLGTRMQDNSLKFLNSFEINLGVACKRGYFAHLLYIVEGVLSFLLIYKEHQKYWQRPLHYKIYCVMEKAGVYDCLITAWGQG